MATTQVKFDLDATLEMTMAHCENCGVVLAAYSLHGIHCTYCGWTCDLPANAPVDKQPKYRDERHEFHPVTEDMIEMEIEIGSTLPALFEIDGRYFAEVEGTRLAEQGRLDLTGLLTQPDETEAVSLMRAPDGSLVLTVRKGFSLIVLGEVGR